MTAFGSAVLPAFVTFYYGASYNAARSVTLIAPATVTVTSDETVPTMTVISPDVDEVPGTAGAFPADFDTATTTAIVFDLADNSTLAYAAVFHTQSNGSRKCVYRRGAFEVGYRSSSQVTTDGVVRLHVRLDGGWPAGEVELVADLVDAGGNLSMVS